MLEVPKGKKLSLFSIVMINVMAVDSLRTLPISAQYGYALVFYYVLAALIFFIPSALATAELAKNYPETGGSYVWVRNAFGERWAFVSIWLQWFYNVCWYPTIMALVSATMAYLVDPTLADNKTYMVLSMIGMYSLLTLINYFGLSVSSKITNISAILGTLLPMLIIIVLGISWVALGKAPAIPFSIGSLSPDLSKLSNLVLLTAVLYGLVGIEMSAMHAGEVIEPEKTFPRALVISSVIILCTLILSSLAIALVVPKNELNLVAGLLQAFNVFFESFHIMWLKPYIACSIILGAIGGVVAWIIGPAKGLMVACDDGCLPSYFAKKNQYDVPYRILTIQLIIFILLSLIFVLLPSVNAGFWLLTDITSQLALLSYIFFFAAFVKLDENTKSERIVPGGRCAVVMIGTVGISASLFAVFLGFIPPSDIPVGDLRVYEGVVILGLILGLILPLGLFSYFKKD